MLIFLLSQSNNRPSAPELRVLDGVQSPTSYTGDGMLMAVYLTFLSDAQCRETHYRPVPTNNPDRTDIHALTVNFPPLVRPCVDIRLSLLLKTRVKSKCVKNI